MSTRLVATVQFLNYRDTNYHRGRSHTSCRSNRYCNDSLGSRTAMEECGRLFGCHIHRKREAKAKPTIQRRAVPKLVKVETKKAREKTEVTYSLCHVSLLQRFVLRHEQLFDYESSQRVHHILDPRCVCLFHSFTVVFILLFNRSVQIFLQDHISALALSIDQATNARHNMLELFYIK